jgi:hypothetical protein
MNAPRLLAPAVAVAACLTSCGGVGDHRSHAPTPTVSSVVADPAARAALTAFGQTFGRYLDGQIPATNVAGLAPGISGHLSIRLSPAARTGALRVTSVSPAPLGQTSTIVLRDRLHTIPVKVILRQISDRDRVVWVSTGDLDSVAQPPSPPLTPPKGSGGAQQAAKTFLTGYLPWLYSHGVIPSHQTITPRFAHNLRHATTLPQAPGTPDLHPRVAAIGMQHAQTGWLAEANIADAQRTYQLNLTVTHNSGRWAVTTVEAPGGQ